jgi:hypothetical protein
MVNTSSESIARRKTQQKNDDIESKKISCIEEKDDLALKNKRYHIQGIRRRTKE